QRTRVLQRPLRALKVWLAIRAYGAGAFRRAITRNLEQAQLCANLVREAPNMELVMEPQLSVVLYRRVPTQASIDANEHNRVLAKALQADGRVYVAGANVDGVDCLRACFVNFRTREDDVRVLIQVTEEVGANLEE
ncbi:MAG: pyridoxal-dependent decarboxylase, partial [Chloroflexota bacterium]